MSNEIKENLGAETDDPLVFYLNKVVILSVKALAVMMVFVILWALVNVAIHLYQEIWLTFVKSFHVENIFSTLGAFLIVLIAVEIFLNIVFFLQKDAIYVPLVLATALTAIARKVIILDYSTISTDTLYATAALLFAVGITYWLVTKKSGNL